MSAPEIMPQQPVKKPNVIVIILVMVVAAWLTGVVWSFAGDMMTSATDIGPLFGMLLYAVTGIAWTLGLVALGRKLYRFYTNLS